MSDPPLSRKLGRGFARLLAGLLGRRNLRRTRDSLDALREEYRRGREGSKPSEEPPRPIPHREVDPISDPSREPPPAP